MSSQDPILDEPIRFSDALNVEAAARVFAARGRVRIADVLAPASAETLYACLATDVPWRLTYNEGRKNVFVDAAELEMLGDRKRHELVQNILTRAQNEFQYLFRTYSMVTRYLQGDDADLFLHYVFEWLNDPRTLAVLRTITGIDTLRKANAQATLYRPGHFLTQHDDSGYPEQHRRVAYVLHMTRGWRAEWGGELQFLGSGGEIEEAWLPVFNSLALFTVPTPHLVSYVAPFAREPRYAITGWLCDAPEKRA